ncbi:DUF3429 domain-containing protein [Pelagibius litoralis]|uniref:DUF3429 domain-containing protein n=1 Tax=Pelagibius litoralis TaxID=374515 RepID=A0A967CB77_9PROT|nr:DUF3429 domain-containing protein [Pelagibius litoralis]
MPGKPTLAEVPRPALVLGFAGLIPFVAAGFGVWLAGYPQNLIALDIQLAYGAVILSFMGAVHWGLAMADRSVAIGYRRLGWSVVPALIGWLALLLNPVYGLLLMTIGFAGVYFGDLRSIAAGHTPSWYRALRKPLTIIVIAALASSYGALILRV